MKSVLSERKALHPPSIDDIEHRELPGTAAQALRDLAAEIARTVARSSADAAEFLADPALLAQIGARAGDLPAAVHTAVRPPATAAGACIVRGLPLSDSEIGPTPPDWQSAARWSADPGRTRGSFELDIAMLLLAAAAGEPFGWAGQQDGRLVNNIIPAAGHEFEQSGASSTVLLSPHTEDAFHPLRANMLMLACLRNLDSVGTTVSSVRRVRLPRPQQDILRTPTLPILPDVSYGSAFERAEAVPVPTLWSEPGHEDDPGSLTLRFDPAYTPLGDAGPEFREAYAQLERELERVCAVPALRRGELLLLDNDVAVHGRVPFTPRYDGTDRWLKRVNIRLPERPRRAAESRENGYGQQIVAPFAPMPPRPAVSVREAREERNGAVDDRGSIGHT
ncbi:TauD/TfdA family dioxygenase [Nocardia flavorosea]|uniref:Iron hydroxylase n=1 Tax=Nocardia flavorosea TaxID=53429 RepID=A0A846Y926_9NOCA|nr:TauD/TfdA family dioxygenase [Nocardia flavorosea]NKY55663.1 iron hydroxylase [Nocardia flavorosea]